MSQQAGIIVIGNEVLSGKVTDLNSTYLMAELRELGVPVKRVAVVPDDVGAIADEVARQSQALGIVFTTGGVGPTHDDVTFEGVARGFGVELVHSAELADVVRDFFGHDADRAWLRLAEVPDGTELVWSEGLPFPVTRVRNVYVMPGDPTVLRKKFAAIREMFRQQPFHLRRLFTRLDEGRLAAILAEVEAGTPGVQIGSYPVYGNPDYEVQITIESKDEAAVEEALAALRAGIPQESVWKVE